MLKSIKNRIKLSSAPEKEAARIEALYQLQILDTAAEEDFNNIVALASQICQTPISAIAFADEKRWWFKAKYGVDFNEISADITFCVNDLQRDDLMVVNDLLQEKHFFNNPLVTSEPGTRFYAGMPLITPDGFTLGHLCVMDKKPRALTPQQLSGLRMLGKQVVALLQLRLHILKSQKKEQEFGSIEEQMNIVFHNAIDAVIVMDIKGIIVQWNPKAETIFGWTAAEAIGKNFHETIIPERCREVYLRGMEHYEKTGEEHILNKTIEISAIHKNNSEFDVALGISPTTIKDQCFFIGFVKDITDRKLVSYKLDKQKEFYENILNKIPTDIAVFDAQHKYLFVNPSSIKNEELRRYIIGKDDFEYCEYRKRDKSVAELRRELFLEAKKSAKEIRWEDSIKDNEGNTFTHLRRMFPVYDEKGELTMMIGFGIDITDRKIMEEKQAALVKQLSAQNTQLVDFCNIVSHNLRAPLVNISMLVSFIEESKDETDQRLLISKLNPVIENLHTTFNELVESIQIKQDLEIKSEKINLKDCLQRTTEGLAMEINKSEAVFEINFDEAPIIYYPSKYLFSLFHNLISNALKYQSPQRKPIIKLETKKINGDIIFSVKDNGLGIDLLKHKENLFKIGKVFHRHPNAKGFGLYMTKTQVEAMGGRIWVESIPGEGSTFFVEFKNQSI